MADSVTFRLDDGGGGFTRIVHITPQGVVMTGEMMKPMPLTKAQAATLAGAIDVLTSGEITE